MPKATLRNLGMRPDVIMMGDEMGRVLTQAKFENPDDVWQAERGQIAPEAVRRINVGDALVDTGCSLVGLPRPMIDRLGLQPVYRRSIRSTAGPGESTVYSAVRLTIGDRFCTTDVMEMPDDISVLIGQIPLEQLDFVVDLKAHRLIGNPAHGGEHILEAY